MIVVDWIIIGLFLFSFPVSWFASRWGRAWVPAITIITTLILGFRSLHQFEFGSTGMAWTQAFLFLIGLLAIWIGVQRAKKEPGKASE